MPGAKRAAALAVSIALAASGLACATTTRVGLAEDADFASFHTWDWHGRVAPLVDGQHGGGSDLDGLLSRLIHRSLAERGYTRSRTHPDFYVTYDFELRRRIRIEQTPRAPYLLSSMHSSPSYWIEGSNRTQRVVRRMRLSVAIFEPGGRIVWKGVLDDELGEHQPAELAEAVEGVLARFPAASEGGPTLWAVAQD